MKLKEFYDILKEVCKINHLDQEYRDAKKAAVWIIGVEWDIEGVVEYIPSSKINGTYDDPPEAFAKEYQFQRSVEEDLFVYAVAKVGNKAVFLINTEIEEDRCESIGVEYDGTYGDKMLQACRDAGLTGDEDVYLKYDGKLIPFAIKKVSDADVGTVYNTYHRIMFFTGWTGNLEPSDYYNEVKAEEIAETIDPEEEIQDQRDDYYDSFGREDWD